MSAETSVLYDAPGPRARTLYLVFTVVGLAVVALLCWVVYGKFDEKGQWASELWKPMIQANTWTTYLLPGLLATLKAFVVAALLSVPFGVIFAAGRLSQNRVIRWVSGAVVEFFRAIPVLLLMFFLYYVQTSMGIRPASLFWAVVLGLMLYNGSVIAEVLRAGVNALPRGQREAGNAIGLRPSQVLGIILFPQAFRSMLPAIIAQLVVVLKDTALGYILGFQELLRQADQVGATYFNVVQAAIVVAAMYIVLNLSLGWFATWLERRLSRAKKGGAPVHGAEDAAAAAIPGAAATGIDTGRPL